MNESGKNSTKTISTSDQAIGNLVGNEFIEWFKDYTRKKLLTWPEIQQISKHKLKVEKLRKFMLQYFLAVEAFWGWSSGDPGFLEFAQSNLSESDDPQAESALLFLDEKEKIKSDLHQNWIKLLKSLGLSDEDIKKTEPKEPVRNYLSELSDVYSNAAWQETVGAFAALEEISLTLNRSLLDLLNNNLETEGNPAKFLEDSQILGEGFNTHTHLLGKIVFDQESKELILNGANRQLNAFHDLIKNLSKYLSDQNSAS